MLPGLSVVGNVAGSVASGNDEFTSLLLHAGGANGTTTFTDSSVNAFAPTVTGNAHIDTGQFKFGTGSMQFDTSGDYLAYGGQSAFAFGTGEFAIDMWIRLNTTGVARTIYDGRPAATNGAYPTIDITTGNLIRYITAGLVKITSTTALAANTWYHIALTRGGTNTRLFVNGTQEGSTFTDSTNYIVPASRPRVAADMNGTATFDGYIDELRVSKGAVRWSSNFTPPTEEYGP